MEFEILKENLLDCLNIVLKSVSQKSSIQSLSNVLIKTEGSKVIFATTNLDVTNYASSPSQILTSGSASVNLKKVHEYIQNVKENSLTIKLDGNVLVITTKKSKAIFNTMKTQDFPKLSKIENLEPICKVSAQSFFNAINSVSFCSGTDTFQKIALTGVFIEVNYDSIKVTASNGVRLAHSEIKRNSDNTRSYVFLVPAQYISDIAKIEVKDDSNIEFFFIENKNIFAMRYGSYDFLLRQIDGAYPDYTRIIPSSNEEKIKVNKEELQSLLKLINVFKSEKNTSYINVTFSKKYLSMRSIEKEVGEATSNIDVEEFSGEESSRLYDSRSLLEVVSHIGGEFLTIYFNSKQDKLISMYGDETDTFFILSSVKPE